MSLGHGGVDRSLKELENRGLVYRKTVGVGVLKEVFVQGWSLTEKGNQEAHGKLGGDAR